MDSKDREEVSQDHGNKKESADPFHGEAPIAMEKMEAYKRGSEYDTKNIRNKNLKRRMKSSEEKYNSAVKRAARYELLLTEEPGFLETEEGEESWSIDQRTIADAADIASANKHFELKLNQFGPYRIDYTRNGRHLLIGGRRGHVAAFDWITKQLTCEMNVMEAVQDQFWKTTNCCKLNQTRPWIRAFDSFELRMYCTCASVKEKNVTFSIKIGCFFFMSFSSSNQHGFLQYTDVSIGNIVSTINTKGGRLNIMCHNPHNAVVLLGHHNGSVTMWTPNQKEPVVKMLCHNTAIRALAVDQCGNYLATSGQDRKMKIYDVRMFKPLHSYQLHTGPSNLCFSQRNLLAATCQNVVQIYKDPCHPYLTHRLRLPVEDVAFCPYEDVLGVGGSDSFVSLLVPGAGEANYDAFESNPNRSKKQRREWEVKALLEKIQPDMISLDPMVLSKVDHVSMERLRKDKEERMGFVEETAKFEPKHKNKGRSKSGNVEKRKQKVHGATIREQIKEEMK
uniref:BING4 C-terminal domain-containing protein n=1 Tax=Ciona savignyi TaxID=51511 RepID=H2Z4C9_CIOSA